MNRLMGFLVLLMPIGALAEVVGPIESVQNFVNIRMSADPKSEVVGRLSQGDYLPLVSTDGEWLEIEIAGGATGFISANWVVVHDEPPVVAEEDAVAEIIPEEDSEDLADVNSDAVATEVADASDLEVDEITSSSIPMVDAVADDVNKEPIDSAEEVALDDAAVAEVVNAVDDAADEDLMAEDHTEPSMPITIDDDVEDMTPIEMPAEDEKLADDVVAAELDKVEEDVVEIAETVVELEKESGEASATTTEDIRATAIAPGEHIVVPQGVSGPPGPPGEPGPPGPPGAASIEGAVGFLTRFTAPTVGASSQVYDDGNNVGIGTTTPVQRLEVNGNIQIHEKNSSVAGLMITQSDGETGYIMHNRASTLTIGAGSIDRITIDSDGNVGFGVSRPEHPIELTSGAHVTAGGVWTNSSSRVRKENIAALSAGDALAALSSLEPVEYNYKNDQLERYVGFIAEDVPDLVATADRDALSPMDIVAVLTKVVQEQQKKIEALEARLDQR